MNEVQAMLQQLGMNSIPTAGGNDAETKQAFDQALSQAAKGALTFLMGELQEAAMADDQ
jgi:hypothetical protein